MAGFQKTNIQGLQQSVLFTYHHQAALSSLRCSFPLKILPPRVKLGNKNLRQIFRAPWQQGKTGGYREPVTRSACWWVCFLFLLTTFLNASFNLLSLLYFKFTFKKLTHSVHKPSHSPLPCFIESLLSVFSHSNRSSKVFSFVIFSHNFNHLNSN